MSDYKFHINNRFSSCRHIANARDPHRGRDVKLFHLPGNFEYVGVFDGTDAMICPVIGDPYSAGVARLLQDIRDGKPIEVKQLARARNRIEPQMELPLVVEGSEWAPKLRVRVLPIHPITKERHRV